MPSNAKKQMQSDRTLNLLDPFLRSAGSPLTSLLIYKDNEITRKVLTRDPISQGLRLQVSRDVQSVPARTRDLLPEALTNARSSQLADIGGQTVFCVGSLAKQMVLLAFYILVARNELSGITLTTSARDAYNQSRASNQPSIGHVTEHPSIESIAVHCNGYAPANRFLFPPNGECIVSDCELIERISEITENWAKHTGVRKEVGRSYVAYSNLNIAIIALIMVNKMKVTNVNEILSRVLFNPLGMTRTTSYSEELKSFKEETSPNVASGFRMSHNLTDFSEATNASYMSSTVAQVSVGMWSCTDDLARMYREIIRGHDGESEVITREVAKSFLGTPVETDEDEPDLGPAGYVYDYPTHNLGCDSLNRSLGSLGNATISRRGRLAEWTDNLLDRSRKSNPVPLHHKGGTVDGFTCSMYLCAPENFFTVVLCNSVGPLDLSEPLARCVTEEVLSKHPTPSIVSEIETTLQQSRPKWQRLMEEDDDCDSWIGGLDSFLGSYQDHFTGRIIKISGSTLEIWRQDEKLWSTKIAARSNRIRLFPTSPGLFVDRVTVWKDPTFELQPYRGTTALIGDNGLEKYIKFQ